MENPRVTVRMDRELYEALIALAHRQTRSPANLCLHALRAYISKNSHGHLSDALRTRAKASEGKLEVGS